MNNIFEKISSKLAATVFARIGLVDMKTQNIIPLYQKNEVDLPSINCTYEEMVYKMCDCVTISQRKQLAKELQLSHILTELDSASSTQITFKITNMPKKSVYKIFFTYYDESKEAIIFAFIDETNGYQEHLTLSRQLRRTEKRFELLRAHICVDYTEVNIQTGECITMQANNNKVTKGIYKEQIGWFANNVVAEEEREAYLAEFNLDNLVANLRENNNYYTTSYTLVHKNGRYDVLFVNMLIQGLTELDYDYIACFAQDITVMKQQEAQNQKLLESSRRDDLTGLYNRMAAEGVINKYLTEEISDTPGTLAIIDIDYFKQVNDSYGHHVGDSVLIQLAKNLKEVFRSDDILCRWGGDEFLVFLQNISDKTIIEGRLERLRVRMLSCTNEKRSLPITISIGAAVASPKSTVNSLFQLADTTLYKVKKNGRNGFLIVEDKCE